MGRRKDKTASPTYYSTYQVARLLGVSPPAVVKWVDSGILPAHRTPGGHRRIDRRDLVKFAREYDYPLPQEVIYDKRDDGAIRVLVVDDEQDFLEMVRDYLEEVGGFRVELADSGFTAGFTVARFHPDVVVIDIMMPGMDGFEVLKQLREDPETREIPVVACTAYRDDEMDQRITEARFDGFIQKPLKLEALVDVLKDAIEGKGRRRE